MSLENRENNQYECYIDDRTQKENSHYETTKEDIVIISTTIGLKMKNPNPNRKDTELQQSELFLSFFQF